MQNLAIIGAQWGDEGKGKIVDMLAARADVVVRFQGGNNAGHTVVVNGRKSVLHLVPSGALHPGKVCVIGNGVVIDPVALLSELAGLKKAGVVLDGKRLKVSDRAHLIMPYHKVLDLARENMLGSRKIGTTGRGIGPAYEDKVGRLGIRAGDLLAPKIFKSRLQGVLKEKNRILRNVFHAKTFGMGDVYSAYLSYGRKLKAHITDASLFIESQIDNGRKILFEGAQGTLLDVDHGTYPFVTSSNTVTGNAASGSGIAPRKIEHVIGVTKAYTTRVGSGPFPTELMDETGEMLRQKGGEFGATTGRPRRCGWLDMVALKYARRVSGIDGLAVTKLDVLSGIGDIKVCVGYGIRGRRIDSVPCTCEDYSACVPIYRTFKGWNGSLGGIRSFGDLPPETRKYIGELERMAGLKAEMISTGADRADTIVRARLF